LGTWQSSRISSQVLEARYAQLVFFLADGESPGKVALDDERGDALVSGGGINRAKTARRRRPSLALVIHSLRPFNM